MHIDFFSVNPCRSSSALVVIILCRPPMRWHTIDTLASGQIQLHGSSGVDAVGMNLCTYLWMCWCTSLHLTFRCHPLIGVYKLLSLMLLPYIILSYRNRSLHSFCSTISALSLFAPILFLWHLWIKTRWILYNIYIRVYIYICLCTLYMCVWQRDRDIRTGRKNRSSKERPWQRR